MVQPLGPTTRSPRLRQAQRSRAEPNDLAEATNARTSGGAGFTLALGDTLGHAAFRSASTDAWSAEAAPGERLKVQGDCVGCRAGAINTCPDSRFNAGAIIIRP
ncbi:hypothetical protein Aduo_012156 [Ancylostoma duodenale]